MVDTSEQEKKGLGITNWLLIIAGIGVACYAVYAWAFKGENIYTKMEKVRQAKADKKLIEDVQEN